MRDAGYGEALLGRFWDEAKEVAAARPLVSSDSPDIRGLLRKLAQEMSEHGRDHYGRLDDCGTATFASLETAFSVLREEVERLRPCANCGRIASAHLTEKRFCDATGWIDRSGCGHGDRFTLLHDDGSIIGEQA